MQSIASAIIALNGWPRIAVGVVAGAVSALALPPFDAFPLLWLTIPVFIWLLDGAPADDQVGVIRRLVPSALVGWAFGFGYFSAGLWWLGAAFLVEADQFLWLMPLGVVAFPAALALFWGLGTALARLIWRPGWRRLVAFAVAMAVVEWLRGHLLTGFPWNAFGYTLTPTPVMMQTASLVGLWGMTLAAFFIFAAPAALAPSTHARGGRFVVAIAALLLVGHWAYGVARLPAGATATIDDIHVRIVQPSVPQAEKWQLENASDIFQQFIDLSESPSDDPLAPSPNLLVWPESAFPFLLAQHPEALAAIADLLSPGSVLLTGAARAESSGDDAFADVYNSIYAIGDDGEFLAVYDKVHLVPFGEYLPFQATLESLGFRQLTDLPGGFTAGARRQTMAVAGLPPFSPLICYEAIFPHAVVAEGDRPGWLLNVTNDAWYGRTPGPYQHLQQSRLRAVEEGLPLVRAANNGISAIVDGYGRIVADLDLDQIGVVDGPLPAALTETFYGRFGDWMFLALIVFLVIFYVSASSVQYTQHD